jgi:hypothetical protein
MKYALHQGVTSKTLNLKVVGAALVALLLSMATSMFIIASASAHEVVNVANEGNENCYGKLASSHAKEGKGGLKGSYADWNHVGVGLDANSTFQEEVAAIKAACREE